MPASSDLPSAPATDTVHETHSQVLCTQLRNQIQALQSCVDDRTKTVQNQYKRDYDAKVHHIKTFTPGQTVFLDRPPIAAAPLENGEKLAQSP